MKTILGPKSRALRLAAEFAGVPANCGLPRIATAVAKKLHRCPPTTKAQRWELLHEVVASGLKPDAPVTVRGVDVQSDAFLRSYEWRKLRMQAIEHYGRRCQACGASPTDGVTVIHVDHIKPRRQFPHLALVLENLQILCEPCNHGKGNWSQTDWRPDAPESPQDEPFWARHVTPFKQKV